MFKSPLIAVVAALSLAIPATASANGSGYHGGSQNLDSELVAQRHGLDMYKVEQFVDLQENDEIDGLQLKCAHGDYAVDGMWRVDQVNFNFQIDDPGPWGDWNRYNGVDVTESRSVAKDTWSYTFLNNTAEKAQAHVWITCLGRQTQSAEHDAHKHAITLSDRYDHTDLIGAGEVAEVDAGAHKCDNGEIVVAPGFIVPDGVIKLYRSWPSANLRKWRIGFYTTGDPNVTTSIRCLKVKTEKTSGHRHTLQVRFRASSISVKRHFVDQLKVDCGQTEKGLVGAFDILGDHDWDAGYEDHMLWYIGQEPQIKSRVFHVWNHDDSEWDGDFGLVCFDDRVSRRGR